MSYSWLYFTYLPATFNKAKFTKLVQKMGCDMGLKGFTLQRIISAYADETYKTDNFTINTRIKLS